MRRRHTSAIGSSLILVAASAYFAYFHQPAWRPNSLGASGSNSQINVPAAASTPLGNRSKTGGCQDNAALQDTACTPGAIIPTASKDQVCVSGYSKSVRNVPTAEKRQVYQEYSIASHSPGQYEIDHLVSLELGGSNDIANLWPEPASPTPGFHEKDAVENYLHTEVCNGHLSLQQAQQEIATNWLTVYHATPP